MIRFKSRAMPRAGRATAAILLSLGICIVGCGKKEEDAPKPAPRVVPDGNAKVDPDPGNGSSGKTDQPTEKKELKLGVNLNSPKAFRGYTLVAPLLSTTTYLIDLDGRIVRTWESTCQPAAGACLLENGDLLRAGVLPASEKPYGGSGSAGRIQKFSWGGELLWDYKYVTKSRLPHHEIEPMPNGNILLVAWDRKPETEALAAGVKPEAIKEGHFLADCIVEIKPTGKTTGEVVWEWHAWDHIVQDFDKAKTNYGEVRDHPELIDVNFSESLIIPKSTGNDDLNRLKGIGYLGGDIKAGAPAAPRGPDWLHINSVAYNAELDQILISVHAYSELWIIDHGTTTAEAAGHAGGRRGKGGDLLYRWGNPRAYRSGTNADRRLYSQHDAQWIPKGYPGEGHFLVFNNGSGRSDGAYSSVDEIVPPVDASGYTRQKGAAFGPDNAIWSFSTPSKADLFSLLFSGAQRLPNGNTLICSGVNGTLMEVTPEKEIVWKYVNPVQGDSQFLMPGFGGAGGKGPDGSPQGKEQIPPPREKGASGPETKEKGPGFGFDNEKGPGGSGFDKDKGPGGSGKKEPNGPPMNGQSKGPPPMGEDKGANGRPQPKSPPPLGQILPDELRDVLQLTPEQRKQLDALQKETDAKFDAILNESQRKLFKQIKEMSSKMGPNSGGKRQGPPTATDIFGSTVNSVFNVRRYGPNFPGLAGRELRPGRTIEELYSK